MNVSHIKGRMNEINYLTTYDVPIYKTVTCSDKKESSTF